MGKESMVLRDLFASVVDGTTVNVVQSTATDLLRATVSEGANIVPWSTTTYAYDISGYTVAQNVGVLYNFYVNTGATLKTLNFGATGDTALSTYISGSTLTIPSGITVTEIITTTTGTTSILTNENYLKVNIFGVSGITVVNGTDGTSGVSGTSGKSGSSGISGSSGTSLTGITGSFYAASSSGGPNDTLFTITGGAIVSNP